MRSMQQPLSENSSQVMKANLLISVPSLVQVQPVDLPAAGHHFILHPGQVAYQARRTLTFGSVREGCKEQAGQEQDRQPAVLLLLRHCQRFGLIVCVGCLAACTALQVVVQQIKEKAERQMCVVVFAHGDGSLLVG
jgi:hypothetical protein